MTTPCRILAGSLLLASATVLAEGFPPPPGPYSKTGVTPVEMPGQSAPTTFQSPASNEYRFAPMQAAAPADTQMDAAAQSPASEVPAEQPPVTAEAASPEAPSPVVGYGAPAGGYQFAPMPPSEPVTPDPVTPEPDATAQASIESNEVPAAPPLQHVPSPEPAKVDATASEQTAGTQTHYRFAPIPADELPASASASMPSDSPAPAAEVASPAEATPPPAAEPHVRVDTPSVTAAPTVTQAPVAPPVQPQPAQTQPVQTQPVQATPWQQPQVAPAYGYGAYPQGYGYGQGYAPGTAPAGGYWQGYGQPRGYGWRR